MAWESREKLFIEVLWAGLHFKRRLGMKWYRTFLRVNLPILISSHLLFQTIFLFAILLFVKYIEREEGKISWFIQRNPFSLLIVYIARVYTRSTHNLKLFDCIAMCSRGSGVPREKVNRAGDSPKVQLTLRYSWFSRFVFSTPLYKCFAPLKAPSHLFLSSRPFFRADPRSSGISLAIHFYSPRMLHQFCIHLFRWYYIVTSSTIFFWCFAFNIFNDASGSRFSPHSRKRQRIEIFSSFFFFKILGSLIAQSIFYLGLWWSTEFLQTAFGCSSVSMIS